MMSFPPQKTFPQQFGSPAPSGRSKYSQGQGGSSGRGHNKNDRVLSSMLPNDLKIPKPPKQPDKPLPAYMRYSRKVWEKVKSQNPDMKMWDIGKLIGEQWRNLPEDERQGFFAEYEVEKAEYQDAMKAYHNSPAYRDWLKVKERATNALQEQQMMEKMMGGPVPKEEPRFQLQQIDEEEDDSEFSAKQVACARFQRNHKLIADIFSEATVPDIKTIVTRPRLENLKRQVQSLMQHQKKLESEIEEMELRFMSKKQKIMDQANSFAGKMKEFDENNEKLLSESQNKTDEKNNNDGDRDDNKTSPMEVNETDVSESPLEAETKEKSQSEKETNNTSPLIETTESNNEKSNDSEAKPASPIAPVTPENAVETCKEEPITSENPPLVDSNVTQSNNESEAVQDSPMPCEQNK